MNIQTIQTQLQQLTPEQLNAVLGSIAFDNVKSMVKKEISKSNVDAWEEMYAFLETKAGATKKMYTSALRIFLKDMEDKNLHILDIDTIEADKYIQELSTTLSPNSVRLRVSAISSFFKRLIRHNKMKNNPFQNGILPPQTRSKELNIPSEEEFNSLLNYFQYRNEYHACNGARNTAKKMAASLVIMKGLGVRIGAISDITFNGRFYSAFSKGKTVRGVVPQELKEVLIGLGYDMEQEKPFQELSKTFIQQNFTLAVKSLYRAGVIKHEYHPHSIRHLFAVTQYHQDRDIYALSKLLNHSSVGITQRYLDSIQYILDRSEV